MRALPLSEASDVAAAACPPLYVARNSRREEADDYHAVIARLNADWRVIVCKDGIQWILQRLVGIRHGQPRWDGRCYCRTRNGLMARVREFAGETEPFAIEVLADLPARFQLDRRLGATPWGEVAP